MRSLVILLGAVSLAAAGSITLEESIELEESPMARRVAEMVITQEFGRAAGLFHYPTYDTSGELEEDRKGVGELLDFLLSYMGPPESLHGPVEPPSLSYTVSVTGGDNPYWVSLSPIQTTAYVYEAEFSAVGKGYISVNLFRVPESSKTEVRSVGFAIPATSPEAKEFAIGMTIGGATATGMPMGEDFEKMVRDSIQPSALPFFEN